MTTWSNTRSVVTVIAAGGGGGGGGGGAGGGPSDALPEPPQDGRKNNAAMPISARIVPNRYRIYRPELLNQQPA
jgi:hypothetical protein